MAKKFFVSSAIDYPSGLPHAGHLYEKICADTIARWHRLKGDEVHFSTGLDCHGQKIEEKAVAAGKNPQAFVDSMEPHYRKMCAVYGISFDDFIKTTEERHKIVVREIFKRVNAKGDIYKGKYEGLYCVDCESYYTQTEAENSEHCPVHHTPLRLMKEDSYFFRMAQYRPKLVQLLEETDLLWPKERRSEILNRLKEPLRDLSISRSKLKWGIPVPTDPDAILFVWFDALVNYLSTIDYPNAKFKKFWPADAHVIGRDIVWHHTVIWWSILLSAGLPLPRVVSHGFVNTESGDKMSKAAGNVIDPNALAARFGSDSVRYFFLREIPFGYDGVFSEEALVARHNNELANELGNLASRVSALIQKKCGGKLSKQKTDPKLFAGLHLDAISSQYESFAFNRALEEIFSFIGVANKYVNDQKP
ncbi:MAG: methionine--tRNA ligase, partial [Candidatus Diapherotrites archaeon]|nr:methionine--tRNA ligase [Candidatus Diapherotrites archaeon]